VSIDRFIVSAVTIAVKEEAIKRGTMMWKFSYHILSTPVLI
jgi:hypothetical protein